MCHVGISCRHVFPDAVFLRIVTYRGRVGQENQQTWQSEFSDEQPICVATCKHKKRYEQNIKGMAVQNSYV